jgi:hypothetical protein
MPLLLLLLITSVLAGSVQGQSSAIDLNSIAPKDTVHSMNPLDIKDNMEMTDAERLMVIEDFLEKIHRGVEDLGLCTLISIGYSYQICTLERLHSKWVRTFYVEKKLVHFSLFVALTEVVFPSALLTLRLR